LREVNDAISRGTRLMEPKLHPGGTTGHLRYTFHNLVGHPVMEILHMVGLKRWGVWVHEHTLPKSERGYGQLARNFQAGEYFDLPYLTAVEIRKLGMIHPELSKTVDLSMALDEGE